MFHFIDVFLQREATYHSSLQQTGMIENWLHTTYEVFEFFEVSCIKRKINKKKKGIKMVSLSNFVGHIISLLDFI